MFHIYLYGQNKKRFDYISNLLEKHGIMYIEGQNIDIDSLQKVLYINGYQKGNIGSEPFIWYKNILSNKLEYIAKLETIDPNGDYYTVIVEDFSEPIIKKIKKGEVHNQNGLSSRTHI